MSTLESIVVSSISFSDDVEDDVIIISIVYDYNLC
jgi:hypothetical protein